MGKFVQHDPKGSKLEANPNVFRIARVAKQRSNPWGHVVLKEKGGRRIGLLPKLPGKNYGYEFLKSSPKIGITVYSPIKREEIRSE